MDQKKREKRKEREGRVSPLSSAVPETRSEAVASDETGTVKRGTGKGAKRRVHCKTNAFYGKGGETGNGDGETDRERTRGKLSGGRRACLLRDSGGARAARRQHRDSGESQEGP